MSKKDHRPICNCDSYPFPHKIGGKCTGRSYTQYYFNFDRNLCDTCNCCRRYECDISNGSESIEYAECYIDFCHYHPGEHLPLNFENGNEYDRTKDINTWPCNTW